MITRQNMISKLLPIAAVLLLLAIWQMICSVGAVSSYLLPSPVDVMGALVGDFSVLMGHAWVTVSEAFLGLFFGIITGFILAVVMDVCDPLYRALYPLVVLTQTIPTVAIAPLLVLWMGYGILPKVVLIIVATFFPVTVSLLEGFREADKDLINMMKSMGAGRIQIFRHVKFPLSLGPFFASLKISVSYAIVGAVISEWLGGFDGLGVYMTRVKKSFSFDKMFAVIFLICVISLLLIALVNFIQKRVMPWEAADKNKVVEKEQQ